jgi:Family of unknown function (DUF6082)
VSQQRVRPWRPSRPATRIFLLLCWVIAALAALAAVLMSPFALRAIERLPGLNWSRLANVGQTYEAVAALLAVPTFGGVMISLLVQRREVHTGQEQTALLTQIELARIAIEHPDLMTVDGTVSDRITRGQARRNTMMNLWMSKWRSLFGLGGLTEQELRALLARFFQRDEAREWWALARESYRVGVGSGRQRRFAAIADEEYLRVLPHESGRLDSGSPSAAGSRLATTGVICLAAAGVGTVTGWLLNRRRSRSSR